MAEMKLSNTLVNDDASQKIAYAQQVWDKTYNGTGEFQSEINKAIERLENNYESLSGIDSEELDNMLAVIENVKVFLNGYLNDNPDSDILNSIITAINNNADSLASSLNSKLNISDLEEEILKITYSKQQVEDVIAEMLPDTSSFATQSYVDVKTNDLYSLSTGISNTINSISRNVNFNTSNIESNTERISNLEDWRNNGGGSSGGSLNPEDLEGYATEEWVKNLINYKAISVEISNNKATNEVGSTITNLQLTIKTTKQPRIISVSGSCGVITIDASLYSMDGGKYKYVKDINNLNITSNSTCYVTVQEKDSNPNNNTYASASASTSINFYKGVYSGVLEFKDSYSNQDILSLSKVLRSNYNNWTVTLNAGENKYYIFAIPSSYGTPKFTVGGFTGGINHIQTINFTNIYNHTEEYKIYRGDYPNTGSKSITLS